MTSRTLTRALARRLGALVALPVLAASGTVAAAAGPGPGPGLARYYGQHVTWTSCRQGSDDEQGRELDRAGARCARITVPLDHTRPGGRTITIALSRIAATDRDHRVGAMMLNEGGPAEPTLGMPLEARRYMGAVGARYDLVGMDPRFVGRSTPLDCGWPGGMWIRSAGSTRAAFDSQVALQKDLAERCARSSGDVLPYADTRDTARDIDIVRAVLGERRLSYLGYSYGSYLGAVYAQMFPGRTDRMVLDSPGDPRVWGPRLTGTEGPSERALRAWAAWTAARHGEYGLGRTRAAVLGTVARIVRASAARPLRVGRYTVDEHLVPYLVYGGVGSDRDEARASFASSVKVLDAAARGEEATPTPELEGALRFNLSGGSSALVSPAAAILCGDRAAPRDPEVYWGDVQRSRHRHPLFGPITNNIGPCAFWPAPPREQPTAITTGAPALLVSATGDTATTYRGALGLHGLMSGSRLLTLRGTIAHGIYGEYGAPCVDAEVNAYLASGTLPSRNPACAPGRR
ncbi:alpha/beta hydrolase [Actinomadura sp. NEAU-AAG7]|uniref:alpha/beta hydrolase n=1 Tax=Actinomadura sp. NEAU-AAG7 TaxID=2839640 RepID=UPI001BE4AC57|nr:alpha/beta hydrolase [Actinomadura sp. NEAU-AAG7]MBT2208009.1 alpha/beta hydrolase [Actinomadura sp. NEAU-AAG7]